MKTQKYRIEEEALLDYLNFKNHLRLICLDVPIKDSEIIDIAWNRISAGNPEDYYQQRHFLIIVTLLDEHKDFFYPGSGNIDDIRKRIVNNIDIGDLPMSISFSRDNLMVNVDWITDDIINELLTYHYIEKDVTEEFWKMVLHAHDQVIYNLPWIKENESNLLYLAGYDNIRDFMEDMGNPGYDEEKRLEETRKFIYNLI